MDIKRKGDETIVSGKWIFKTPAPKFVVQFAEEHAFAVYEDGIVLESGFETEGEALEAMEELIKADRESAAVDAGIDLALEYIMQACSVDRDEALSLLKEMVRG